jgi:hypothetical protein
VPYPTKLENAAARARPDSLGVGRFLALGAAVAASGCGVEAPSEALVASARLSEVIPTVLVLSWEGAPAGSEVTAEWGTTDEYGETVPLGTGEAGTGTVVGMHSGETAHWRLVVRSDGDETVTEDHEIEVGYAPDDLPFLTVEQKEEPVGGAILTNLIGGKPYAVVYDHSGLPVWWYGLDAEDAVFADNHIRPDGKGLLLQVMDGSRQTDIGALLSVDWSGESVVDTRLEGGHHAFVVLPDGTRAWCATDVREAMIDGVSMAVVGDAIRELPGGEEAASSVRTVWSSWDTLTMNANPATDSGFYPEGLDWTHCNGLAYDSADAYLMSAFALGAVVSVSRADGAQNWVLGGDENEFAFEGGVPFTQAHSPDPHAGGLRIFSNRNGEDEGALYSRVIDYELDVDGRIATEISGISLNKKYFSYILGDSNPLSDGHLLISWGSTGALTEVNEDRALVWSGSLPIGKIAGFAENVPAMGGAQ